MQESLQGRRHLGINREASGSSPLSYNKALDDGDTHTVWKLDRLARSLRDLVAMLDDFNSRGIQFRSLTEEINTTTPGGKLVFHIFAALAEFERGLIIERTREGMKAARARGVKSGPKPKLTRQQIEHARKLIDEGQRHEATAPCSTFRV
jgi:DNA invertase Pin-like site-specific DNA recombinase